MVNTPNATPGESEFSHPGLRPKHLEGALPPAGMYRGRSPEVDGFGRERPS